MLHAAPEELCSAVNTCGSNSPCQLDVKRAGGGSYPRSGPASRRKILVLSFPESSQLTPVVGDIFKYNSPEPNFASIELNIDRTSKKVVAAYFYYKGVVSWKSVEAKLGKNFKKQKMPNGRPMYIYQFQNRTVAVLIDSADNVYNLGLW